ncbi:MAG: ketopantoate reductase family protein [Deltaproteobacteria bacterium]|nr:ketopantoate reductase family protein [Nannocystaceae bacterium]
MRIAIVGPGAIGSTFAFQLARAGHDVTVVARGKRLAELSSAGAVVLASGERAEVTVAAQLDPLLAFDLVLVTVLATQVAAILPVLAASRAHTVMFMFNTFEALEPLCAAVGAERFAFGFPGGVFTLMAEGRITPTIRSGTTVGTPAWAKVFTAAGIPTVVDDDMQSWLRTHAAMVYPLMAIGVLVHARGSGISWAEARRHADALRAGTRIVQALGNDLRPGGVRMLSGIPRTLATLLLWAMSRTKLLRELGQLGSTEPRMLADMMHAAKPELAAPVLEIRP